MTPQEKATDLIKKFTVSTLRDFSDENFEETQQCALIAVDEIIEATTRKGYNYKNEYVELEDQFWVEVKLELENL